MISTKVKTRLPKHLAYPVRTGQLTDALAGGPYFDKLTVGFYASPFGFASKFAEALRSGTPYPLVRAGYEFMPAGHGASADMIASGIYGPNWKLSVYPVPIEQAHACRTAFLEVGLPAICEWLSVLRTPGWLQSWHDYTILYSTKDGAMTVPR